MLETEAEDTESLSATSFVEAAPALASPHIAFR
jgi:hypothetical protein